MPSAIELQAALAKVIDPETFLPITEMGMVKRAEVVDGVAKVKIDLTVESCPMKDTIRKEALAAAKAAGFSSVDFELGVMSADELDALKKKIGAKRAAQINPQGGPAHGETAGKLQGNTGGINRLPKKAGKLIAISSGKGGVGKSSVTAQLACAMRREGFKVGVLDADITGPSVARIFGNSERPMVEGEDTIIPVVTRSGVAILSMNQMVQDERSPVIWRGPLVNGAIRQMYANAKWEGIDVLLVDMPPGTSDATLTVFQSLPLDGVIFVTTPQALVGMIVDKSMRMAQSLRVPILGLVENLAYVQTPEMKEPFYLFGTLKGEKVAAEYKIPFLGALPIKPELAEACDKGEIDKMDEPIFRQMAKRLMA